MLLLCVIIGILAGYLAKGKLSGVLSLKALILPIIAFALSAVPSALADVPLWIRAVLTVGTYVCCGAFFVINREYLLGSVLAMVGTICNFLVIAANGFKMPVSDYALTFYSGMTAQKVLETRSNYFVAVNGEAKLLILGDVICVPLPVVGGFMSIGDGFLGIGLMVIIITAMTREKEKNNNSILWAPHK